MIYPVKISYFSEITTKKKKFNVNHKKKLNLPEI